MKRETKSIRSLASLLILAIACLIFISCARQETGAVRQVTRLEVHRGDNYKIGVILPLTGKYAVYGESTLHGIECAVGIFPPCEGPVRAELVVKDDAGRPDRAALAVEELATKEGVSVIIGPLSSSSIEAAAQRAQELGIPLISLSQQENITRIGDYIFSVALTAASQVNAIVDWAVNSKNIKTFAIAYPMNPYGTIYKQLFMDAVDKRKGKVVLAEGYGETTLDFGSIFRKGGQKFGALFIPDSYRAVGYLSSALLLEGVENVQLLGINRWNNPELVERGGDAMQGAVFVDGFFDGSASLAVQRFVSEFEQVYGIKPTILEAQAFDAAMLALKALRTTGGEHPKDVRDALAAQPEVEGASGEIGFDANREAIKRLFLLTVKKDGIVELEGPAPVQRQKGKYGDTYTPANRY